MSPEAEGGGGVSTGWLLCSPLSVCVLVEVPQEVGSGQSEVLIFMYGFWRIGLPLSVSSNEL